MIRRIQQGRFITLEGGEGSGKTTQIRLLEAFLMQHGESVTRTREPQAESIRNLLLTGAIDRWHPLAETLLFQAARVEHVANVVAPALSRGETVLCDRFLDSTLVYQGVAKGLGVAFVQALHRLTLGNFQPDLAFVLDIDPVQGLRRAGTRAGAETRFETMDIAFHHQVREGFLALAHAEPGRYAVIDASGSEEEVHRQICARLDSW